MEAAPKFVMTWTWLRTASPSSWLVAYWCHQEDVRAYYSTHMHAHEYYTQEMIQVFESCLERESSWWTSGYRYHLLRHSGDRLWRYLCSAFCWY
jgi:hypothetical protein